MSMLQVEVHLKLEYFENMNSIGQFGGNLRVSIMPNFQLVIAIAGKMSLRSLSYQIVLPRDKTGCPEYQFSS